MVGLTVFSWMLDLSQEHSVLSFFRASHLKKKFAVKYDIKAFFCQLHFIFTSV